MMIIHYGYEIHLLISFFLVLTDVTRPLSRSFPFSFLYYDQIFLFTYAALTSCFLLPMAPDHSLRSGHPSGSCLCITPRHSNGKMT